MSSRDRKFLLLTLNFFLWQEWSSFIRKFLSVTGNFFLWQEIFSCERKFLPMKGNFFLSQEIFPKTRNFFLWHEVSYQKFLSGAGYFWNILSLWYKVATKVRDFCLKLRLRVQGFLPRFLAPWSLKSHPATHLHNTVNSRSLHNIVNTRYLHNIVYTTQYTPTQYCQH